ncbi:MAG: efflux RND transporter periplasmic adaptor subunit [Polyangia bacterium]
MSVREKLIHLVALALCGCHAAAHDPPPRADVASPAPSATIERAADAGWLGVVIGDLVDVAAPLDARVTALLVRVGDRVAKDAPLARLDRTALDEDLAMAVAAEAAGRAARARATLERGLARERAGRRAASVEISRGSVGLSSDEERSTARYEAELAATRLRAAEAELAERAARVAQLRALAREAELRAPCDGVIAAELVDAGAQARRGAPIVRLLAGATPRVRFAVPEPEIGAIAVGAPLRVVAGGRSVAAVVARVAPQIDRSARMLFVEARLDDGDGGLRVGEVARVVSR